jgi:hypothetical protein
MNAYKNNSKQNSANIISKSSAEENKNQYIKLRHQK